MIWILIGIGFLFIEWLILSDAIREDKAIDKTEPSQKEPPSASGIKSPLEFLRSTRGRVVSFLTFVALLLFYWEIYIHTLPLVTPQSMESSSSILHFKIEDPSFIFDMRDVTLGCQVLKIETGPASKDAPVRFITPTIHENGRVLSEIQHFVISYGKPIDFECGAESVFQMERAGAPFYPPRIELEILIEFKTLWFQRTIAAAGPFVATRVGDKYQWTHGISIKAESIR